jgi:hypothetical protein
MNRERSRQDDRCGGNSPTPDKKACYRNRYGFSPAETAAINVFYSL